MHAAPVRSLMTRRHRQQPVLLLIEARRGTEVAAAPTLGAVWIAGRARMLGMPRKDDRHSAPVRSYKMRLPLLTERRA
eukprot:14947835-Heterocapsa_arctica.AAC.1